MSNSILFRELGDVEIAEFKAYARENHKAGDPIDREIWHPVIVEECELIDMEAITGGNTGAARCIITLSSKPSYFIIAMRERGESDWNLEFGDLEFDVALQEFKDRVYCDGHEYQFLIWECLDYSTQATAADLDVFNSEESKPFFDRFSGAGHVKLMGGRAYL